MVVVGLPLLIRLLLASDGADLSYRPTAARTGRAASTWTNRRRIPPRRAQLFVPAVGNEAVRAHGHEVRGVDVDGETRCAHYGTERDVVALRFGCCESYYPCFRCHAAVVDHEAERWPAGRRGDPAALCGVCGAELTVDRYVAVDACPDCGAAFNPGCADHYDRYFEPAAAAED